MNLSKTIKVLQTYPTDMDAVPEAAETEMTKSDIKKPGKLVFLNLKIGDAFFYFNPQDPDLWADVDWKRKIRKYVVTGLCHVAWIPGDTQILAKYSKNSNPHFLWTSFFGKSCFHKLEDAIKSLRDAGFELSEVEE